jgi:hypothetical protein
MALLDDVKTALEGAGVQLKADLWRPSDRAFLEARARDLVGLAQKAAAATDAKDAAKRAAYVAAAKDTVNHVKLLAMIRMETAQSHVIDALERFFLASVLPALIKALPALVALA